MPKRDPQQRIGGSCIGARDRASDTPYSGSQLLPAKM
jgi:hypothetical protein